jgi:hypothetical protein
LSSRTRSIASCFSFGESMLYLPRLAGREDKQEVG